MRKVVRKTRGVMEVFEARTLLAAPTLAVLPDVNLLSGAPLQVPLDGFDADGDTLTYTVSTTSQLLTATLSAATNRSLKISVAHTSSGASDPAFTGDMVLSLFEDRAPRTTARIVALAQSGFYNNLLFHRVIPDFVIQGGDPLGNGTGGSGVEFDDEFDPGLQFTGPGLLAMAKSSDDTNDSQFFINEGTPRNLDFNHTIFGQLVEGDAIREKISNVPRDANDKPLGAVKMTSVTVFADKQNRVLSLSVPQGAAGAASVTVTVNDGHGGQVQRTFNVNVTPDTFNDPPYLLPIADVNVRAGTTASLQLNAVDVEGDGIAYLKAPDPTNVAISVNVNTGATTITPSATAGGVYPLFVGVIYNQAPDQSVIDTQITPIFVTPAAPTSIDLLAASDTGVSGTDNVTRLNNANAGATLQFQINGVLPGAIVKLFDGALQIGQATVPAGAASVTLTTSGANSLANGVHNLTATQTLSNLAWALGNRSGTVTLASLASAAIAVTVDTTAPSQTAPAAFTYLAAAQNLVYVFSEDVSASLAAGDLTLKNVTTNTVVPAASIHVDYSAATKRATFTFPGFVGGVLPDGNYHASLTNGSVTDVAGNALAADAGVDFFVLGGDANRDRAVDFNDLVVLAQNYNTTGKTYAQGDFNYDGKVDFNDLVILAQRYNTSLAAPAAPVVFAPEVVAASKVGKAVFSETPIVKPAAPVKPKAASRPVKR